MPTKHTIEIRNDKGSVSQPTKSKLTLSDRGVTLVDPGDTVIWVNTDPRISSFLIKYEPNSTNLFEKDPRPFKKDGKFAGWTGKIKKTARRKQVENYSICWARAGQVFCLDPKIQING
jgi:hypothetical protein